MSASTLAERFWAKVQKGEGANDCWLFVGCRGRRGYGLIQARGKLRPAHRVSYEMAHPGEVIPVGLFVCHSCDNPPCVNPAHLWLGTNSDNIKDAYAKGRAKRHVVCRNKLHAFTPENTIYLDGVKRCKACVEAKLARHTARRAFYNSQRRRKRAEAKAS